MPYLEYGSTLILENSSTIPYSTFSSNSFIPYFYISNLFEAKFILAIRQTCF